MKIVENNFLRIILKIAGWVFLGLGILGLVLPVMPGAVFLIISLACFIRSSEKMYKAVVSHKFLGRFVKDYAEKGVISDKTKLIAIITLIIPIISSIVIYNLRSY